LRVLLRAAVVVLLVGIDHVEAIDLAALVARLLGDGARGPWAAHAVVIEREVAAVLARGQLAGTLLEARIAEQCEGRSLAGRAHGAAAAGRVTTARPDALVVETLRVWTGVVGTRCHVDVAPRRGGGRELLGVPRLGDVVPESVHGRVPPWAG
jgi:hypothetical protein